MADANTGTSGTIRIDVSNSGGDVGNNRSQVNWAFYLIERVTSNSTFRGSGITASVDWSGVTTLWSGSFGFSWTGAGNQTHLIASGSFTANHEADGSKYVVVQGNMGASGTSGAGGPTAVAQGITLAKLTSLPGTPSSVSGARVSDTQVDLSWAQTSPSNGQPTGNDIEKKVNGSAFGSGISINASNSASVGVALNQKIEYRVRAYNGTGASAWSATSTPVYTTPGTPTNGAAAKGTGLDIGVTFTPNVAYTEHEHDIQHGVVSGGVTTWDAGILATLASGVTSYTHVAPNSAQVHTYRIRSKAGALASEWNTTNSVQLLVAPNKPTVPAMPAFADKASALTFSWQHNPIDTTPQKFYEFSSSTNGGAAWSSSGKITSSASTRVVAAGSYVANTALTVRVRTWGSATTGGSDGTGASPWSDLTTVTYKTIPVATILSPANGSTVNDATLRTTLGFSQPEAATFVKAQLELLEGVSLVDTLESTQLVGITLNTPVQNGLSYAIRARVQDSNGLWSEWKSNTFSVTYLAPVQASASVSFLPDTGFGQLDLDIPAPGAGQSAATLVTVTRTINGAEETIVQDYPVAAELTFLDTTPTVNGTNTYKVTTTSALGAQKAVTTELVTTECRRAYLSKGQGFSVVSVFGGNLDVSESLSVASTTRQAVGRTKPIGLYGVETSVSLKVSSFVFENFGSTVEELRGILLLPGKACYRDASGRRVFGSVKGSVAYKKVGRADLSFTLIETS